MSDEPLTAQTLLEPAERLAQKLAELANNGDALATSWLERLKPTSKEFLAEVVEAVGTFAVSTKTYPRMAGRRIEWGTMYSVAEDFVQQQIYGEDRTRKARYAYAVARVLADNVRIGQCKLPTCREYFVHPKRDWCSDSCSNVAHASASRKHMTTDEWIKHQIRRMRESE